MSVRTTAVIRRRPRRSERWRGPLLVITGLVVIVGLIVIGVKLIGGTGETETAASPVALPCETVMVVPAVELPDPSTIKINVFNSTDKVGLAAQTAQALGKAGFIIMKTANDPKGKPIPGVAQIRYGNEGLQAARLLRYYIPGAEMVHDGRDGKRVDVALGLSFLNVRKPAEVAAELASPSPSPSGEGCQVETPEADDTEDSASDPASTIPSPTASE